MKLYLLAWGIACLGATTASAGITLRVPRIPLAGAGIWVFCNLATYSQRRATLWRPRSLHVETLGRCMSGLWGILGPRIQGPEIGSARKRTSPEA